MLLFPTTQHKNSERERETHMTENFPISHFFTPQKGNNSGNLDSSDALPGQATSPLNGMLKTPEQNDGFLTNPENHNPDSDDFELEELKSITEEILENLKASIPAKKFATFFESQFTVSAIDDGVITFSVTTNFIKKMIKNFYISALRQVVSDLLGAQFQIEINVMNSKGGQNGSSNGASASFNSEELFVGLDSSPASSPKEGRGQGATATSFRLDSSDQTKEEINDQIRSQELKALAPTNFGRKFDESKTFSNFIVGQSNAYTRAFALAVAKDPGGKYPQLYIYGNSGLGKTHLLHAICNYIKAENPRFRIALTTATDFMAEMVMAIQNNNKDGQDTIAEFRRKYTDLVDVLIIDDIHELAGKSRTQSEFFYIFNELQAKKKQLIFTSDKTPKEIDKLEDRIRTRLNSTLLTDIQQPDFETRIAILKKKAMEKDIFLDDEVINLIASSVKTNVRELEGHLIKLGAYSELAKVDVDLEIAKQQLNLSELGSDRPLNIEMITKAVANYFSIPLGDIRGKTRKKDVAMSRHIAMYMSHKRLKNTLEEIGLYFAKRDHSTVIHGVKKIEDLIKKDSTSFSTNL